MRKTLVILAAGVGRRFGGLKQIQPVGPGGEAIVEYSIYDALKAGFERVVCVTRRQIEGEFEAAVGCRLRRFIELVYVHQELDTAAGGHAVPAGRTKPWGTGHAVLVGGAAAEGPFAVVNADDFYGAESLAALGRHLDSGSAGEHALVGFPLAHTLSESGSVARGVCRCSAGRLLTEVTERVNIVRDAAGIHFQDDEGARVPLDPVTTVSMNLWGFQPALLDGLQRQFADFLRAGGATDAEFRLPDAVNTLVAAGRATVRVLPTQARWCGITYAEDQPQVRAAMRERVERGEYPHPLWSGR